MVYISLFSFQHGGTYKKRRYSSLQLQALAGEKKTGFDEATVLKVAEQVKKIVDDGMQVAIVIGGGNFWRGRTSENMERTKADQIGMLATVMNCIYVSAFLCQLREYKTDNHTIISRINSDIGLHNFFLIAFKRDVSQG